MSDEKMSPLEAARKAKADREKAARDAADALELATLELEEKLTATCGRQGIDFEVVVCPDGPIGLKRADALVYTRFQKTGEVSPKALDEFIVPCLEGTSASDFRKIADKFPVVAVRCATALSKLFGAKSEDDLGKY